MKVFEGTTIRPESWLKAGLYASVILLVYYSTFKQMISAWSGEEYSYCWFIPFVALYIIWEKRVELARLVSAPSWQGLAPLGVGVLFYWLGELGGEYTTLYLSLWFVIIGIVWLHIGWRKMRIIAFAFMVMLAMFPLPNFIYTRVTVWAKMISSQLGVWMLHMAGMSAYREGNIIDLGFTLLQVVDACSGLRYILPMMLFGLLLAYWFKAHIWKRTALFLSSLPLSILLNSFRIALTGILYSVLGASAAEGFFHGFSGWLVFMASLPVFLLEMFVLKKLPPKEKGGRAAQVSAGEDADRFEKTKNDKAFLQPPLIVSMAVLLLTAGLSHAIEFRQHVAIGKPLSQFPLQVGEWKGARENMEQQFRDALMFSDYIIANFTDPQSKSINFYVAYYQDQRKGEAIHSPETCLPMGGWTFIEEGDAAVSLADGKSSLPVNRAFIEKTGVRELAYYWFPQRGRTLTKLYQLKLYAFWDSLTKQRADGALVRVITPVYPSERLEDAENRLQSFTREIVPVLDGYIPGKSLQQ
ncbi:MAG TPA: VPLPA-CTERM-specific exosortase XrtD [Nitrospirota bacterium]|nr:VPLPA-CTERM-specific exosortase XrtD [Nitrospirota bacterium]